MYIEYNHIRCGKSLIELDEIHWRFRDGNQSVFWWNLRFVHLFQAFIFLLLPKAVHKHLKHNQSHIWKVLKNHT